MDFGRVITAMVTPFDENLEVDFQKAKELALFLTENGSDSIVVAGTTGESPTLTKEEKIRLFQEVVDAVKGKAKVIAGTGSNSTNESIELTKAAEKCGVDGIMLVVPYYNKPPQEGLYNHFKAIAAVTSKPVMLYNVPGRTACNLLPETVVRLAAIDNIVCIKEASGNLEQIETLKKNLPSDFIIYSGDDSLTLPILALGGHGIVSVAAHVIGNEMQTMIKEYLAGNKTAAQEWHEKLTPVFKNLFITSNPILVKAAMNLLGHKVGGVRLPLVDATSSEIDVLKETLRELKKL